MNKLICPLCGNDISDRFTRTAWMGFYVCAAHDDGTLEKQMMALPHQHSEDKNFLTNVLKSQYEYFIPKQNS